MNRTVFWYFGNFQGKGKTDETDLMRKFALFL